MNVGELKSMLEMYPNYMEILSERCSDYCLVEKTDWSVVSGVKKDGYVMRTHPTMSAENKLAEKEYLHLAMW